ncbi:MAG: adenine phosphoribosyltransferase [archaeon]
MELKEYIRTIPDFPKKGIMFRDITTLIKNPEAFDHSVSMLYNIAEKKKPDVIAGIESRGFIFGAPLALRLGASFIPIRKKGKLPGDVLSQEYSLEYGTDKIEIHKDAIKKGQNVIIIDDLIATGGTLAAAAALIKKAGGNVDSILTVIELPDLKGREKLREYELHSLVSFEGD